MRNGVFERHRLTSTPIERNESEYFDDLYALHEDPWQLRSRWYERRKRALLMAMLPRERYDQAFEPGCGIGELTAMLAPRCGSIVAWDISTKALAIAGERVDAAHVRFERKMVPAQWPRGRFDLVVISELAYYMSVSQQQMLAQRVARGLAPQGTVVACHWRKPIDDAKTSALDAHRTLSDAAGLTSVAHYDDEDFMLDVWSSDAQSVATRDDLALSASRADTRHHD